MIQLQIGMDEVLAMEAAGSAKAYEDFKEKFKPKKTTDDCYTPENIYDVIAGWVANEYNLDRADFVRPFFPGESYQDRHYPEGCVVVDNPPFSILAEIITWYAQRGIRFFLFGPGLTIFRALHLRGCGYHLRKRRTGVHQLRHEHGHLQSQDGAGSVPADRDRERQERERRKSADAQVCIP